MCPWTFGAASASPAALGSIFLICERNSRYLSPLTRASDSWRIARSASDRPSSSFSSSFFSSSGAAAASPVASAAAFSVDSAAAFVSSAAASAGAAASVAGADSAVYFAASSPCFSAASFCAASASLCLIAARSASETRLGATLRISSMSIPVTSDHSSRVLVGSVRPKASHDYLWMAVMASSLRAQIASIEACSVCAAMEHY